MKSSGSPSRSFLVSATLMLLAGNACATVASPGGKCGANVASCPTSSGVAQCCSKYGYCGVTTAYCGTGCQAALGACKGSPSSPTPSPGSTPKPASPSPGQQGGGCPLTKDQQLTTYKLTTLFENSVTDLQYGYCERLGDGRGYTAGIVGFCTNNNENDSNHYCSDALEVVQRFASSTTCKPPSPNPMAKYMSVLSSNKGIVDSNTGSYPKFCADWAQAAKSPCFRAAQDQVQAVNYFNPSQVIANSIGASYALTRAFLYDTSVQHGEDGLKAIMKSAGSLSRSHTLDAELAWLSKAMRVRYNTLHNNKGVWEDSEQRVVAFQSLLASKQLSLSGVVSFSVSDWPNTKIQTSTIMAREAPNTC